MTASELSAENKKESFGIFLTAIALSACYIIISRFSLALSFWETFLTLDDESRVKGYFISSLVSFSATILLSLWFIISFVKRRRNAKFIFLFLVTVYLLFHAASYIYGEYIVGLDVNSLTPDYVDNLLKDTIIFLFILTPYMFFSSKAKKVFVTR